MIDLVCRYVVFEMQIQKSFVAFLPYGPRLQVRVLDALHLTGTIEP